MDRRARGPAARLAESALLRDPARAITLLWETNRTGNGGKADVKQGTLALMILKTLDVLGPLHGYGIARRIEETCRSTLTLNYGTLYPALLKLEQEGFIKASWRASENNRRAKFYALTAAGRRELARETREWHRTADLIAAFLAPRREDIMKTLRVDRRAHRRGLRR